MLQKIIASGIKEFGFSAVQYLSNDMELKEFQKSLADSWSIISDDKTAHFQICKVYRLYFMKLAPILIDLMNKLCFKNTQLMKLLLKTTFKRTSLAQVYVTNEEFVWKDLRNNMIIRILMVARYSETGRMYAASLFLNNLSHLYSRYLLDHSEKTCSFLDMIDQILCYPSIVIYVVEKDFLRKFMIIVSQSLHGLVIKNGVDIVHLFQKDKNKRRQLLRVIDINKLVYSCLCISLNDIEVP
ncbi:hypothetical protein RF11_14978 [Thelohanellus kitauei]|uniref:Uncharacterized protein n=1 Tax=Thelohanellus kitauei TaxID=669202 RepID=A0A0C2MAE5_THEKT|nr:hypothetical protein RF11_14978 [Thelohanellus kitauei]